MSHHLISSCGLCEPNADWLSIVRDGKQTSLNGKMSLWSLQVPRLLLPRRFVAFTIASPKVRPRMKFLRNVLDVHSSPRWWAYLSPFLCRLGLCNPVSIVSFTQALIGFLRFWWRPSETSCHSRTLLLLWMWEQKDHRSETLATRYECENKEYS